MNVKNIESETLANLALAHHAYIPVFEKYSLDFCCRGKKSLQDACTEKKVSLQNVINDLNDAVAIENPRMPFTDMTAEQLISHIIVTHHYYIKNNISLIYGHIEKVVTKHGNRYPNMPTVLKLFLAVIEELLPHMEKEEKILFPKIKEMSSNISTSHQSNLVPGFLDNPILMMEKEHDRAGQILFEIRTLTNQYIAPEDACTTHKVCLAELKAFEEDLHQHVHLENNILFPMARKINPS